MDLLAQAALGINDLATFRVAERQISESQRRVRRFRTLNQQYQGVLLTTQQEYSHLPPNDSFFTPFQDNVNVTQQALNDELGRFHSIRDAMILYMANHGGHPDELIDMFVP
tara:strand:- start:313 stop:645 length:333 start_codon:yes stop_codon:yes gene_type:complete